MFENSLEYTNNLPYNPIYPTIKAPTGTKSKILLNFVYIPLF